MLTATERRRKREATIVRLYGQAELDRRLAHEAERLYRAAVLSGKRGAAARASD